MKSAHRERSFEGRSGGRKFIYPRFLITKILKFFRVLYIRKASIRIQGKGDKSPTPYIVAERYAIRAVFRHK